MFMCQAIGSLFSGMLASWLGRKRAMYIVNIPHIIGWGMLYFAQSVNEVFIATVLLGVGNGLLESPVVLYVGEIA